MLSRRNGKTYWGRSGKARGLIKSNYYSEKGHEKKKSYGLWVIFLFFYSRILSFFTSLQRPINPWAHSGVPKA